MADKTMYQLLIEAQAAATSDQARTDIQVIIDVHCGVEVAEALGLPTAPSTLDPISVTG